MGATTTSPCTAPDVDARGAISLPILATGHGPRGQVRKSKSGRRRAIVLATVQIVMIAHVVVWLLSREFGWWGSRTLTPVEPSESMEFVKHGVINAGLIFFAVTLLSTLVLGRWFCGWGCHVVMLQDLCGWMMRKAGIRPKAFRSRLLIYVPLLLALYMFVWPVFYRLAIAPWIRPDLQWPGVTAHLTTTEFWQTFPGVLVAIPFLLVCGFAAVYFLGSKGFCTYGCPYGGFFAPLDEFAPGRIRVTDACEQCGHCTAVCTSNVRVHEEVREYGMVVDPGCMKCLDCVSVCPTNALYFGFGRPAQIKGKPAHKAPVRHYDLTWPEEIALALVFGAVFFSVRGVYNLVPMLMAGGVAGVVTFLAWKLWRLVRDPNVRLHRYQFKLKGHMQRAGWVFAAGVVLALALTAHCGVVNGLEFAAISVERGSVLPWRQDPPAGSTAPSPDRIDRAMRLLHLASPMGRGGIGLAANTRVDLRMAQLYWHQARFDDAERSLRRVLDRTSLDQGLSIQLITILRAAGRHEEVIVFAHEVLRQRSDFIHVRRELVNALVKLQRLDEAIAATGGDDELLTDLDEHIQSIEEH